MTKCKFRRLKLKERVLRFDLFYFMLFTLVNRGKNYVEHLFRCGV